MPSYFSKLISSATSLLLVMALLGACTQDPGLSDPSSSKDRKSSQKLTEDTEEENPLKRPLEDEEQIPESPFYKCFEVTKDALEKLKSQPNNEVAIKSFESLQNNEEVNRAIEEYSEEIDQRAEHYTDKIKQAKTTSRRNTFSDGKIMSEIVKDWMTAASDQCERLLVQHAEGLTDEEKNAMRELAFMSDCTACLKTIKTNFDLSQNDVVALSTQTVIHKLTTFSLHHQEYIAQIEAKDQSARDAITMYRQQRNERLKYCKEQAHAMKQAYENSNIERVNALLKQCVSLSMGADGLSLSLVNKAEGLTDKEKGLMVINLCMEEVNAIAGIIEQCTGIAEHEVLLMLCKLLAENSSDGQQTRF